MYSTTKINKDYILSRLSEEEIYFKYLGIEPKFKTGGFTNPLRDDDNGDCYFYVDSRNRIKFHDIAQGWNWDCFNVVQHLYGCNFETAVNIIAEDFELIKKEIKRQDRIIQIKKEPTTSVKKEIQVKFRKWRIADKEFWWNNYGIDSKLLKFFNVYPISHAWIKYGNKLVQIYWYKSGDEGYAYYFGDNEYKLYFPHRDKKSPYPKFFHSNPSILQGVLQLPETYDHLIFTKSYKDVIALRSFGYYSVATMTEKVLPTKEQFNYLKSRCTTNNIFTLLDNDMAGKRATIKYKNQYNTIPLLMQEEKDFTDELKRFGSYYIIDLIEDFKNYL